MEQKIPLVVVAGPHRLGKNGGGGFSGAAAEWGGGLR